MSNDSPERKKDKKNTPAKAGEKVMLNDSVELFPSKPLPQFDMGVVQAFGATKTKEKGLKCFALVCARHLIPRMKSISKYEALEHNILMRLETHGIVFWPPANEERYVFIYRQPAGERLVPYGQVGALGWSPEKANDVLAKPLIEALQSFHDHGFVHGGIRLDNIYYNAESGDITLGDCLSTPPSYAQPVLYEPINRGMCMPVGRGHGKNTDDLYAFGVTVACVIRAGDLFNDEDDDALVRLKIENGSYDIVTSKERFRGTVLELLRGVLHDDITQRWQIDQAHAWLYGTRLSPKQAVKPRKSPRPLVFNDEKYFYTRFLAMDLPLRPDEALYITETEDLHKWLSMSVEDSVMIARVDEAIEKVSKDYSGHTKYSHYLASVLSTAVDPYAPFRYGALSFMADSLGHVIAYIMQKDRDQLGLIADILLSTVLGDWLHAHQDLEIDVPEMSNKLETCRTYMKRPKIGFGIERCLYTLMPDSHCLSEKLNKYYVLTPEHMVRAFDDICEKGGGPSLFLDRHSVAFLSVHDTKSIDSFLYELTAGDEATRPLVDLKVFALIQKRSNMGALPHLAGVLAKNLKPFFQLFKDKQKREDMIAMISKYAQAGDLSKMADALSSKSLFKEDEGGFLGAKEYYLKLDIEAQRLAHGLKNKYAFGREAGSQAAATLSSVLAFFIITFIGILFFTGRLNF